MLPMGVFLVFTWVGTTWPAAYAASYVVKTILTAVLLWVFWKRYTKIRWNHWGLGIVMGVLGLVQWVGMQKGLIRLWPGMFGGGGEARDLTQVFSSPVVDWSFIVFRWAGAALVVPVMEELFWRDYLWRTVAAPADFRLASVGEWERGIPLVAVSIAFSFVHGEFWLTAIGWGLMVGLLLAYTRSLGACVVMHGVTNFLLGAYVLYTRDWRFW